MSSLKSLGWSASLTVLGFVLLSAGGCGNGEVQLDPEGGAKLKQARIAAYGQSGIPSGKPSGPVAVKQDLSGQAAARQRAQSGR